MAELGESSYRRFLQADPQALEEMVRTYSDGLVRFVYGYVRDSAAAEDVAAEAIATLFLRKLRFEDEPRMRGYLYKIARSRAVDYLRRHKQEVPLEDVENVLYAEDSQHLLERRMRNEAVWRCMQKLPQQYREVLQLAYFDGFSLEQTAKILSKTMKQIYNLHSRAKAALRVLLEQEEIIFEEL